MFAGSFTSGFVPGILGDSRRACCCVIGAVIVVVLGPLLVVGVINNQWGQWVGIVNGLGLFIVVCCSVVCRCCHHHRE